MSIPNKECSPLQFWTDHAAPSKGMPDLAKAALRHLRRPLTSVDVERSFSHWRQVKSEMQATMCATTRLELLACPSWASPALRGPHLPFVGLTCPSWATPALRGPHLPFVGLTCPSWASPALRGRHLPFVGLTCPSWASPALCGHHACPLTMPAARRWVDLLACLCAPGCCMWTLCSGGHRVTLWDLGAQELCFRRFQGSPDFQVVGVLQIDGGSVVVGGTFTIGVPGLPR
eukprot:gene22713-biopygen13303